MDHEHQRARPVVFCPARRPFDGKRGGGFIVSIFSPGSIRVLPEYVVVGASKAALEALTRYLAVELAYKNIIVNTVSPGVADTEALHHFDATQGGKAIQSVIDQTPAGRLVSPEDIAQLVVFLCSPAASMIRGQVTLIGGGYSLLGKPSNISNKLILLA